MGVPRDRRLRSSSPTTDCEGANFMRVLNDLLDGLPPLLVYAVVGALVFGEVAVTAGLVLPAATALILMGLLANAGTVSIGPALAVAVGAAWLGGTVAYRSGRRLGARARTTR